MKKRLQIFLFSLVYVFIFVWAIQDKDRLKCRSIEGSKSCGQCIRIDSDCAWCLDPQSNSSQRCNHKEAFTPETCAPHYVYSPNTELEIAAQHNLQIGSKQADGVSTTQLEPQQVVIKLKHGDILEVPFKYRHRIPVSGYEVRDFSIQTSEFRSFGLGIEFFIDCNGSRIGGRVCTGIKIDQIITFYAKITLNECKTDGDIAVSIGVYGYNTVSGLFITPICGCECEKLRNHEKSASSCTHAGTQVCGACQCEEGHGGNNCECSLAQYGASNSEDLENRCRQEQDQLVCSGKGKCNCGECQCNADIRGKYCECDSTGCPVSFDGKLCSGHGECECGKCICEEEFSGEDCSCSTGQKSCEAGGVQKPGIEEKTDELPETDGEMLPPVSDSDSDIIESNGNNTEKGAAISSFSYIDFFGILSTVIVLLLGYLVL